MENYKQSKCSICFYLIGYLFICSLLVTSAIAKPVKNNEKKDKIKKTIQELLQPETSFKKLKKLNKYKASVLKRVSGKSILELYKKYKSELLTDHFNTMAQSEEEVKKWGQNIEPLSALISLAKLNIVEKFFSQLEKDIDDIVLEKKKKIGGAWGFHQYPTCAEVIFTALVDRYGPNKLEELSSRFQQKKQDRLRIILLSKTKFNPENKREVKNYVLVLSRMLATQEFDYTKKQLSGIGDLKSLLFLKAKDLYRQLNNKQQKQIEENLNKYGLYEELEGHKD